MSDFKKYAIIVSGGVGSRMKNSVPKQFLEVNKLPILMHSIRAFNHNNIHIVLVQNDAYKEMWASLCIKHQFDVPYSTVSGGETRFHSVKNGLSHIFKKEDQLDQILIAIHDGVRPLVSQNLINRSFEEVLRKKAVVPAVASRDSIRMVNENKQSISLRRDRVHLVQTPQTFNGELLREAYQAPYSSEFTDDASVIEKSGYPIHLIDGDIRNIKITYPIDIAIAELWMAESMI